MRKLILHIPHSSTTIPDKEGYVVDDIILEKELLKLTDWYTNELFHSPDDLMVVADFSRMFCDPERFVDDSQEVMAKYGMGVLYTKTDSGEPLRMVTNKLRNSIIDNFYRPHHQKFNIYVEQELKRIGSVTIIDCHSFPDMPHQRDLMQEANRPDFNIGTDSYHTPQKLIDFSIEFFNMNGHSVWVDKPYSGTIVPSAYYEKDKSVKSIMLEINRKLYLQPNSNKKSDTFDYINSLIKMYLNRIKALDI